MGNLLLKNLEIVLPDKVQTNCNILIENGIIQNISTDNFSADKVIEFNNANLHSGFIDIHNHGANGFDVNESSADDLIEIGKFLASNGVTAWLPTLVPDSNENFQSVIKAIDEAMQVQKVLPVAQILGVHYEGVFANEKMCGALRPEYFKNFKNGDEVSQIPKLNNGIHFTTLAPEVENGIELIKELTKQNWLVSMGHTKADTETLDNAFQNGAKHLTHFFNAMTGLHHRSLGVVGWALTNDDITFDIIADGVHVHPEMLKFAVENKGTDKVSLISDSIAPTGLGDGDYKMWGEKISVIDSKTNNENGNIAGSVITLLEAFKMMMSLGFSKNAVAKMSSSNPAKLLGLEKTHGSIEVGKSADLVVLDEDGNVKLTVINGTIATNKEQY